MQGAHPRRLEPTSLAVERVDGIKLLSVRLTAIGAVAIAFASVRLG